MLITEHGGLGGSSLLYDNWVLTAAPVVVDQRNALALRIKLGVLDSYKSDLVNFNTDIALIKLQHKFSISMNITPICLPGKEERFQMKTGNLVAVSGWGKTETRSSSVYRVGSYQAESLILFNTAIQVEN
uniref:Peptidase S1 domain-containing protein n=1 Tax=Apteryx owenii TaxID=8824 RepID=A0A8B9S664_APTOW